MVDPNPFCESLPTQRWLWSPSSLSGYMRCSRYYYLRTVQGWQGAEGSVHLDFGSFLHGGADVFNKQIARGVDPEEATLDAVGSALEAMWPEGQEHPWGGRYAHVWWCNKGTVRSPKSKSARLRCPEAKGQWPVEGEPPKECPTCGGETLESVAFYPADKVKNHQTLIRSLIEYCDELTRSALRPVVLPDGRVGSELRWAVPLPGITNPDGGCYTISGTLDGLSELGEEEWVLPDIKTTSKTPGAHYYAQYDPSVQFSTYEWGGGKDYPDKKPRPVIICVHVQQNNTDVYIHPMRHTEAQLAEHEEDMRYWIGRAEQDAAKAQVLKDLGRDPAQAYRRNITACHSVPGAPGTPCDFRDICRMDPSERNAFLRSNFQRKPWNPAK